MINNLIILTTVLLILISLKVILKYSPYIGNKNRVQINKKNYIYNLLIILILGTITLSTTVILSIKFFDENNYSGLLLTWFFLAISGFGTYISWKLMKVDNELIRSDNKDIELANNELFEKSAKTPYWKDLRMTRDEYIVRKLKVVRMIPFISLLYNGLILATVDALKEHNSYIGNTLFLYLSAVLVFALNLTWIFSNSKRIKEILSKHPNYKKVEILELLNVLMVWIGSVLIVIITFLALPSVMVNENGDTESIPVTLSKGIPAIMMCVGTIALLIAIYFVRNTFSYASIQKMKNRKL